MPVGRAGIGAAADDRRTRGPARRDPRRASGFPRAGARDTTAVEVGEGLEHANLFAVAEQLAARAATPSTRRQYAAIYRSFADWLREQLGRPPTVADLDADAIAAYARFLETAGGRGGGPAALATRRMSAALVGLLFVGVGACGRGRLRVLLVGVQSFPFPLVV